MHKLMSKLVLAIVLLLAGIHLPAQSWDPEYFPSELMAKEEVREIVEYVTEIRDPKDLAGVGNRIRLARDISATFFFDTLGHKKQKLFFEDGGNQVHDEVSFSHNDAGQVILSVYTHPQVGNVSPNIDSGDTARQFIHQRKTSYFYHPNQKPDYRLVHTVRDSTAQLTDSIQFNYDVLGRLISRVQYVMRDSSMDSLVTTFSHFTRGLRLARMNNGEVTTREIMRFDGENRLITREYFSGKEVAPRLREVYSYDPRGRLANIDLIHDWNHFERSERITHRENVYDDHGKLLEAILDYGDGRRSLKFYDYTYYTVE